MLDIFRQGDLNFGVDCVHVKLFAKEVMSKVRHFQ